MMSGIYAGFCSKVVVASPPPPPPPPPPPSSSGPTVSIINQDVSVVGDATVNITAKYVLNLDGKVYDNANTILENWLDSGLASGCQARATLVTGALSSGTVNTWLVLSTTRSWSRVSAPGANNTCEILIEIRDANTLVVLDSASVYLDALNAGSGGPPA